MCLKCPRPSPQPQAGSLPYRSVRGPGLTSGRRSLPRPWHLLARNPSTPALASELTTYAMQQPFSGLSPVG